MGTGYHSADGVDGVISLVAIGLVILSLLVCLGLSESWSSKDCDRTCEEDGRHGHWEGGYESTCYCKDDEGQIFLPKPRK